KEACEEFKKLQLEFTAPYTPQPNGIVERAFVTIRDMAHAMMIDAKLSDETRSLLWAEAVNYATDIANLVVLSTGDKTPQEMFFGKKTNIYNKLHPFCRIGYVTKRQKIKKKLTDKSVKCLYLGHSKQHASDVYRMFNTETKSILQSRDVRWADWHGSAEATENIDEIEKLENSTTEEPIVEEIDDGEANIEIQPAAQAGIQTVNNPGTDGAGRNVAPDPVTEVTAPTVTPLQPILRKGVSTRGSAVSNLGRKGAFKLGLDEIVSPGTKNSLNARQVRELIRLDFDVDKSGDKSVKPPALDASETDKESEPQLMVEYVFSAALASEPGNPAGFKQAMASPDASHWKDGMKTELHNCKSRKVYKIVSRKSVPGGKKILKTRWVYRVKTTEDGKVKYRSRVVVKGYDQIPGVDFTESFAPTANDTTMKLLIVITLFYSAEGWIVGCIDIEVAFLNADLKEKVFIEIPDGYEFAFGDIDRENFLMLLEKAMYGLVQAPRAFYEKFRAVLTSKEVGLTQSKVDPCLFYRLCAKGLLEAMMVIHVDDCAIAGKPETVDQIKKAIAKLLSTKDEGLLSKHLGVSYVFNDDGTATIHQNDYIEDIIRTYEEEFGVCRSFPTPGYPGKFLQKHEGEPERLTEYRSYVGKLLFGMKKTYPELANAVREQAQHMDSPGEEHWKAVARTIGFLKHDAMHGLTYNIPQDLRVYGCVDSDFATNKDTRKSTTGYLVLVGGCLVSWSSKAQPSVTLSSTEAEYVAASMCGTEVKFVTMLLDELKLDYPKPSVMFEDNTGAIFIMNNDQVGQRTKHIDIKWHHIRDMIKAGELHVMYIRSEDNPADIMTKNTKEILFIKHALSMKKGVLLVGEIANLAHREDVVEFLGVIRQTDDGIFLCVPSPECNGTGSIFVQGLNTGTSDEGRNACSRTSDSKTSEGGNTPWIEVIGRGSRKKTQWDTSIAGSVRRTDRKARWNTSKGVKDDQ
ncbi:Ty1/Copia family ribonuclease HI, partial [Janthinobacterium sp.]|uniref:Ty1/Copia family ribonuclease HI n=1 Tax=Janthinobacterium sp. TaxID=1871054 RepID=UPI00293D23EA